MKKKVLVALGMVMMMGCLAACGSDKKEEAAAANESTVVVEEDTTEAASEDAATSEEAKVFEDVVYSNEDYSITYTKGFFELNEVRGSVQLTYCKEDVQFTGSNEIIITKEEGTTVDEITKAIVGEDSMDNVSDGSIGAQVAPAKIYSRTSESPADSSLTLVDSFMVTQSGDNVLIFEIIRTVGQSDEIDMTIDGAFTQTLESIVIN